MTAIQGLRGTGTFSTDFRPTNYRELYTFLEPNGNAPLQALLAMSSSEATDDPKYNNFRDELPDRVLTINMAGGAAAGITALVVDAAAANTYAVAGALLVNSRTGEVMRATADTTGTGLTVERNIGGTAFTINDNDTLFVAGSAHQEGGTTPTAVSFDATVAFNYTQIFRNSFTLSNTLKSTYLRTGDKEDELQTKALKLHMADIERAMFFGRKHIANGSTPQPTRYTGGLTTEITNVIDVATFATANKMTEDQFDEQLIRNVFKYGSGEKIMFAGDRVVTNLMAIAKKKWTPEAIDGGYGVKFTRYTTFAGDLLVHLHPQFRQIPGMESAAVIVDFPHIKYRYMEGRDTQLLKDRQSPDMDGVLHEYLTECGLELLQDKVHTVIRGWQTV